MRIWRTRVFFWGVKILTEWFEWDFTWRTFWMTFYFCLFQTRLDLKNSTNSASTLFCCCRRLATNAARSRPNEMIADDFDEFCLKCFKWKCCFFSFLFLTRCCAAEDSTQKTAASKSPIRIFRNALRFLRQATKSGAPRQKKNKEPKDSTRFSEIWELNLVTKFPAKKISPYFFWGGAKISGEEEF